jgi:hypothetical protein
VKQLWNFIKPPSGPEARRVVMAFTAILAAGRLGLLNALAPGAAVRIDLIPQPAYGAVFAVLFVALVFTQGARRKSVFGFWVSAIGAGAYWMLAADVWPVVTAAGYYALAGIILCAEAAVIWRMVQRRL